MDGQRVYISSPEPMRFIQCFILFFPFQLSMIQGSPASTYFLSLNSF